MTITISERLEARLRERAQLEGREPEDVVEELLDYALDWNGDDYAEAVEGIRRGFEASDAGRVTPADKVFERMRALIAQHGS